MLGEQSVKSQRAGARHLPAQCGGPGRGEEAPGSCCNQARPHFQSRDGLLSGGAGRKFRGCEMQRLRALSHPVCMSCAIKF